MTPPIAVVYVADDANGIGRDGCIPWDLPEEILDYFRRLTSSTRDPLKCNAVIMGRKTYESIPADRKPLYGHINFVLSRNPEYRHGDTSSKNLHVCGCFDDAVKIIDTTYAGAIETIFVVGGRSVYSEAVRAPRCANIHVVRVEGISSCDVCLSPVDETKYKLAYVSASRTHVADGANLRFKFLRYDRLIPQKHPEYQYLELVGEMLAVGLPRLDRTGTGTISLFGKSMRFDLRKGFPLLTTKKVNWISVVEELIWFIKGHTNSNELDKKGVKIWNANGSRSFLDSRGLTQNDQGDLGPIYGWQWRHFGAKYIDSQTDYHGQGIDQLKNLIAEIKNDPMSRRHIISAWNPSDINKMALPPCHIMAQFYVCSGSLSCQMYQRSADLGLGVPFNIASYSLLTHIIAHLCKLDVGEFIHVIGDAHIYRNHITALKTQIDRTPKPFPCVKIKESLTDIDQIEAADIQLLDYIHHDYIPMLMSA